MNEKSSIVQELQVVAALGLPIQAVINDDEKATVAAVAQLWPDTPHGLCHTHFLKAVQKPIYEADRQLATTLRKPLRALNQIERLSRQTPELMDCLSAGQKQALDRYLAALRAVLLTKGQSPFRLVGTTIFERLAQLTASLNQSHSQQAHPVLARLQQLTQPYQVYQADYERIQRQQEWFLGLADLLNVATTGIHQWATQLEAIREKLRNMQRFRQDPLAFLAETERLWADSD